MTGARSNATVLNVHPDALIRGDRTEILKRAGFEVREAATGAEAIRAARAGDLDVVLLTTRLPDMSGLDLSRKIKEDPATASVMVIETSDTCTKADRVDALETGAALISEPVDDDVLIAMINALVRIRWCREQLCDRVVELETELHTLKLLIPSPSLQDSETR